MILNLKLEIEFMKRYAPQPLACPPSCSPGNLFTILLQLTESEATSCDSFHDIFIEVFDVQICKGHLLKKMQRRNLKKKYIFIYFHQLIYSLPSISCPDLELLAVTIFEISCFLCPKLQRAITQKNYMIFLFLPGNLLIIFYRLTKFEAPSCYSL